MKHLLVLILVCIIQFLIGQEIPNSCKHDDIAERHRLDGDDFLKTMQENEVFIQSFFEKQIGDAAFKSGNATYKIPIVIHVFHNGQDGKVEMEQIASGLAILNNDMQGLNNDWNNIDPTFDLIKDKLDIEFCLAKIDPQGNPTTGVIYYQDPQGMINEGELRVHAWDNYKYMNIYMPKYVYGGPSLFTAYAYYPSSTQSNNNLDGVFYSSIRWGYGQHSELDDGQEWASVITHEVGHWLDLRHTFQGGCNGLGDGVNDTPPTLGGEIELSACFNNDFSCGVATNGSNYMDYNHDCKRMFTKGQVDRMTAALFLPSRASLWSETNLIATGCSEESSSTYESSLSAVSISPNPSVGLFRIDGLSKPTIIKVYNLGGQLILEKSIEKSNAVFDLTNFSDGLYLYSLVLDKEVKQGIIFKSE